MLAVYRVSGNDVETRPCAAGPWNPQTQHGAAPAALIAWAAERVESPQPMRIARITIDLMRPVPVAPLSINSDVVRRGRKIQLISVALLAEGTEVARATVLKTRIEVQPLPEGVANIPHGFSPMMASDEPGARQRVSSPFLDGISSRTARGGERRFGPRAMWFRADRPIVEGEPITPVMRAAITADFCNGVSAVLDLSRWTFVNADVTLALARLPVGEWILLEAETWLGPDGAGTAHARLGDIHGYFGQASQSLVIEHR